MPLSIKDQFTDNQKDEAISLFQDGKTHEEIGLVLGKPRRTIMKLCKLLGLSRNRKEAAELKSKSKLDSPETVDLIRSLRSTHSLNQIVEVVGGSISAIHRLCEKHQIEFDQSQFATLQSKRMQDAWTAEKKLVASVKAKDISPEIIQKITEGSKKLWQDPEYRRRQIEVQTRYWNVPENKERLALYRSNQSGRVSSIQVILYSILDDLNVPYYSERDNGPADPQCVLGPYNFDCVVPRDGQKSLLIECQGDYWHTQDKAIRVDKAKATYFERYLANDYELKLIWEHEFGCKDKVLEQIKYWMGLTTIEVATFDFSSLEIKRAQAKEYRVLLSKYHYLPNAGKGGVAYGAYFEDILVAVCVFSTLSRQNIIIPGFVSTETTELSRLCIHPRYQKKNLASWFVSRCLKQLPPELRCVVSYCDTTFNHDGAVYKALNFKQDTVVRPDYWYSNDQGWVMHKKTLYKKAQKMSLKEAEYADKFGYKKVFGKEKLRFIFER